MFFADGFEETEAIAPLDIMRRAGLDVVTVSLNASNEVTGSHGIRYTADITASGLDVTKVYEAVVLPGGMPGTLNLGKSAAVKEVLLRCANAGSVIAAICAAPSVLGGLGLLKGKKAVCYPGFEDKLDGAEVVDAKVVTDGNVVTAKAMGAAYDFGLALVDAICGDSETSRKVADAAFIG